MWFKIEKGQVKLRITAKPNAKKTALLKITETGLEIAIHAKPYKGEANKELILFLSNLFDLPKSKITLVSGEGSRYKLVTFSLTAAIQLLLDDPTRLSIVNTK